MSDIPEPKEQVFAIQFQNDRENELEFWLEPDGMCFPIAPQTKMEVVITEVTGITISFDKDNNFTLYSASSASVYQDKKINLSLIG